MAFRFGILSASGAWAAALIGGLVFGFGGISWAVLLVVFFLSSSLIPSIRDLARKSEKVLKPRRNWKQVLVNGGPGLIVLLISYFYKTGIDLWLVYGGMIAAVTADTWATEIGVLSRNQPVNIISWKKVQKGDSGAVSIVGSLAAVIGSLFIALLWHFCDPAGSFMGILAITVSGFAGALVDSILGATIQGHYLDPENEKVVERPGKNSKLIRGWSWMNNDVVNLACSISGGLIALLVYFLD